MIDIYIQYSYGGFKTFFIEGKENELVNAEVTTERTYGFPQDAHCNFQYGGAKMIYRYLGDGRLNLVVREIPSIHRDGDGRSIPCAVQFIGDAGDSQILDHIATAIANDFNEFHEFFSKLFRVREGLRIDGSGLRTWIEKHNVPFICETSVVQIKNIPFIKSGVKFFVPLSDNFGKDEIVTRNVVTELKLPYAKMREDGCIIPYSRLSLAQNKSNIITGVATKPIIKDSPRPTISGETTVEQLTQQLAEKERVIQQKNEEIKELNEKMATTFKRLTKAMEQLDAEKKERAALQETLSINKKHLYIAIGAVSFLLIFSIYSLIAD